MKLTQQKRGEFFVARPAGPLFWEPEGRGCLGRLVLCLLSFGEAKESK
jgi:hypothetical protein